jgi:hypothetical protein
MTDIRSRETFLTLIDAMLPSPLKVLVLPPSYLDHQVYKLGILIKFENNFSFNIHCK